MERKRARNRVAASKCRMRKLEKIATLDHEAGKLRQENEELVGLTLKLKEEVYRLQQELQWHVNNGCQMGGRLTELLSQARAVYCQNSSNCPCCASTATTVPVPQPLC